MNKCFLLFLLISPCLFFHVTYVFLLCLFVFIKLDLMVKDSLRDPMTKSQVDNYYIFSYKDISRQIVKLIMAYQIYNHEIFCFSVQFCRS